MIRLYIKEFLKKNDQIIYIKEFWIYFNDLLQDKYTKDKKDNVNKYHDEVYKLLYAYKGNSPFFIYDDYPDIKELQMKIEELTMDFDEKNLYNTLILLNRLIMIYLLRPEDLIIISYFIVGAIRWRLSLFMY